MSRDGYRGPKLPQVLLDKVQSGGIAKNRRNVSRKDMRKAERQAKRQSHRPQHVNPASRHTMKPEPSARDVAPSSEYANGLLHSTAARQQPAKDAKPARSILKRREPSPEPTSDVDTDLLEEDEEENSSDGGEEASEPVVSRSTKRKLEEDDAEIAALEKKLGIRGKKSKALQEDGLDWLAGGSDGESEDDAVARPEDEDWLKSKRRKASARVEDAAIEESAKGSVMTESDAGLGVEGDDFEAFSSEDDDEVDEETPPSRTRQKENPYVAPGAIGGISTPQGKYVPPSLRKAATSDEEMLRRLHRQVQGKVNKVSESNMISILRELEDTYKENARQHVTSTLIDILIGLMTADVAHPDTVLITNTAFAAAVYKVVGTDFGAQLLEMAVERFDHFKGKQLGEGKQPLNLLAFLSYLYNFQVVGCGLLFDYIRLLLEELTEDHTEMLLRVMRISGQQLRQDDPSALKDIVMLLQKLVAQTGEENLSVRTKFMIETINNLKNNRVKTGLAASTIAAEHTSRMKKMLGTLNARAKATEPLRITLADINDTSKKGKWWLVGASYHDPAKLANCTHATSSTASKHDDSDTGYESTTPGSVNLTKLAKKQGMNTDVRRAIFISLLSAADYKDAHVRLMKLHLKNKQQLEIPRVMVTCVGGEESYNAYYALVARRFCAEHQMRKAFQFTLWRFWRELEDEGNDGEDADEEQEAVSMRKVVNLAKFYAALVADGSLSLAVLKKLDFSYLPAKESMFAEVFLTTIFAQLRKDSRKDTSQDLAGSDADTAFEGKVRKVFTCAAPSEMLSGLQRFIPSTVEGSELARTKKEKKALATGCKVALEALRRSESVAPGADDGSGEEGEEY